jgi:hypothetical protein
MHLYWPHQRNDSRRSKPTICTLQRGVPDGKELPWAKQQEVEAAMEQEEKCFSHCTCSVSSRGKKCPLSAWNLSFSKAGGSHLLWRATMSTLSLPCSTSSSHTKFSFFCELLFLSRHLAKGLQPGVEARIERQLGMVNNRMHCGNGWACILALAQPPKTWDLGQFIPFHWALVSSCVIWL